MWTSRPILVAVGGAVLLSALGGCQEAGDATATPAPTTTPQRSITMASSTDTTAEFQPIDKTDAQWRAEMDDLTYRVTREHGTERPFTSDLLKEKRQGTYYAVGGTVPLFSSETKFDSGTGWPSFYDVVDPKHVTLIEDNSLGMTRTEVRCAQTGHHLGHVFEDGPKPTGLRYCINGVALRFEPADDQP